MITSDQREQFHAILESLSDSLDITPTQYDTAVKSYEFVGEWLAATGSPLSKFYPEILPQGSFLIGTMVKPIAEDCELDIDLVCRLDGKDPNWTQKNLKHKIGDRIKDHDTLEAMLDREGRRCWTLRHADGAKFHLDILPAIIAEGHKTVFEKAYSDRDVMSDEMAIRITDNTTLNYSIDANLAYWPKSNPFGYAAWFKQRASLDIRKAIMLSESIQPVPPNTDEKLPLQRVVQILKRHRDLLYEGDKHRPISIIITTLAARAYNSETNLVDALTNVLSKMENYIESRYESSIGKSVKRVSNPVNPSENFADKWIETPEKEQKFYQWLRMAQRDFQALIQTTGMKLIAEKAESMFGKRTTTEAFSAVGKKMLQERKAGNLSMAKGTGILTSSTSGIQVQNHNFHGDDSAA